MGWGDIRPGQRVDVDAEGRAAANLQRHTGRPAGWCKCERRPLGPEEEQSHQRSSVREQRHSAVIF